MILILITTDMVMATVMDTAITAIMATAIAAVLGEGLSGEISCNSPVE